MNWYLDVLKKYAVFTGRSGRQEFWMFFLVNFVIGLVLGWIPIVNILAFIYGLAVLVPSLAVGVRRLHDTGRSGWFWLIWLIPLVGWIILIVFWAQEGQAGDNQYGAKPTMTVPASPTA